MTKMIRSHIVLAAAVLLAGAMSFADDGEATYKAKCAMCHGATGTPSPGMAKMMGIKPVSDPAMKALTEDQIDCHGQERQGQDEARRRADRSADQGLLPRISRP